MFNNLRRGGWMVCHINIIKIFFLCMNIIMHEHMHEHISKLMFSCMNTFPSFPRDGTCKIIGFNEQVLIYVFLLGFVIFLYWFLCNKSPPTGLINNKDSN
jgi:hypothetical protein